MNDTKDRIAALLQDQSNDPPELVYHFTNTEALHSILFQDNEGDAFVLKADQFLTHLYNGYSRNPQQPLKDVLDWAYEQSGLERYIKNKIEGQIMHIDRCPKTHLCLRATEHVYKNDPTEFDYFRNLLINFISKEQSHNTEKINNFLNNYCNM
ncbi:hypothetical protein JW905_02545, partial [bacterium]|nr:hypothetical protein [candidate division CSSED10-310 bacterium]